ncbi:hypothetical protein FEM48_Zijuj02G0108800 [Ziziphus jujuba var. spinosa]|uniref:DUF295 domain-containing protein n=1 Tax=Ziziphus jujuba var. spinosa TaxID=714518 RepID=A0A978VVB4_ZIZJJ|nr:hypothetical protein FEM48_Zijuj02G0108800 [Ziziphus jujuba var. spinosa]
MFGSTTEGVALATKKTSTPKKDRKCTHCNGIGHTVYTCFRLHGYLDWHPKSKKASQFFSIAKKEDTNLKVNVATSSGFADQSGDTALDDGNVELELQEDPLNDSIISLESPHQPHQSSLESPSIEGASGGESKEYSNGFGLAYAANGIFKSLELCNIQSSRSYVIFKVQDLDGQIKCTKAVDLDGHCFFLGDNDPISVLSSNHPWCTPNFIYHSFVHLSKSRETYVCRIEEFSVEAQNMSQSYVSTSSIPVPYIVPSIGF